MIETTKKNVQTFSSAQFGELRTHQDEHGNIWFCLNDVMKALGLTHVSELRKRLKEGGCISTAVTTKTEDGVVIPREMLFIDESNLYRCIFRSKKAEAECFQDWVFEEVLPAIRQTGSYQLAPPTSEAAQLAQAVLLANGIIERQAAQLTQLAEETAAAQRSLAAARPKVEAYDSILHSEGSMTTNTIAQQLGTTATQLYRLLVSRGVLYRQGGRYFLVAKYRGKGYDGTRTMQIEGKTSGRHTKEYMVWTQRGRLFVLEQYKANLEQQKQLF